MTASVVIANILLFSGVALADLDGNTVRIGIDYCQWYSGTGSPVTSDRESAAAASRVDSRIISANPGWGLQYIWGNSDAWETDFKDASKNGADNRLVDDVDLAVWAGHGVVPGSYGASDYSLIMNNQHSSYYARQGDMMLGNRDLEWFVTFTCNFTNGSMDQIGRAATGVHQICGYSTDMTITSNAGDRFSYYAANLSLPITTAYTNYGWATQNAADVNTITVFRAIQDWNDHLWGFGSVGNDPPWYVNNNSAYEKFSTNLW